MLDWEEIQEQRKVEKIEYQKRCEIRRNLEERRQREAEFHTLKRLKRHKSSIIEPFLIKGIIVLHVIALISTGLIYLNMGNSFVKDKLNTIVKGDLWTINL